MLCAPLGYRAKKPTTGLSDCNNKSKLGRGQSDQSVHGRTDWPSCPRVDPAAGLSARRHAAPTIYA